MIEGTTVFLPKNKENLFGDGEEQKTIDTTNILFIVSGAFSGIERIISAKSEKHGIGFGAKHTLLQTKNVITPLIR